MNKTLGFIGAGQMASALASGFVRAELVDATQVLAYDVSPEAASRFAKSTGGTVAADCVQLIKGADVVFLAVKPQQMPAVLAEVRDHVSPDTLLVSIAAGVTVDTLLAGLGPDSRVIRVMPNTPCLVGQAACGFCRGGTATDDDVQLINRLLGAVGIAFEVDEKLLDAVTGLSGSGPAFVYTIIEAMSDGGVRMGLPRPIATALAAQTVRGAAEMVLATGEHTGVLRDKVTSPGGTTIAGVQALEDAGVRSALIGAVQAATERSAELGKS